MYSNFYSELYHYGVPGMRKGYRRYTNPDGTLNAAGKIRYAQDTDRVSQNKKRRLSANKALNDIGQRRVNTLNSMGSQAALRVGNASKSFVTGNKRSLKRNAAQRSMTSQARNAANAPGIGYIANRRINNLYGQAVKKSMSNVNQGTSMRRQGWTRRDQLTFNPKEQHRVTSNIAGRNAIRNAGHKHTSNSQATIRQQQAYEQREQAYRSAVDEARSNRRNNPSNRAYTDRSMNSQATTRRNQQTFTNNNKKALNKKYQSESDRIRAHDNEVIQKNETRRAYREEVRRRKQRR